MTNQITNYKAWRRLDWALLIFCVISALEANAAIYAKGGVEDWTNWPWLFVSIWGVWHFWTSLFGERPLR